jgi:hypothetical protein
VFPSTSARVVTRSPLSQRPTGGRQSRSGASSSSPSTTRSSSSIISNPCSHTGRLNRLAESRGLRLPRRPVVLPLPPCLVALRRDLLRRNPSAPVPRHRARHHPRAPPASLRGVASGRGFLPTVLRYPEPRLPVARMVATIELKLPDLVASYPKLIDAAGRRSQSSGWRRMVLEPTST